MEVAKEEESDFVGGIHVDIWMEIIKEMFSTVGYSIRYWKVLRLTSKTLKMWADWSFFGDVKRMNIIVSRNMRVERWNRVKEVVLVLRNMDESKLSRFPQKDLLDYFVSTMRFHSLATYSCEIMDKLFKLSYFHSMPDAVEKFYFAIGAGDLKVVKQCVEEEGVDPSKGCKFGFNVSAIELAAKFGRLDVFSYLLRDSRVKVGDSLNIAIRRRINDVASLMLAEGKVDPKHSYEEALIEACANGNREMIKVLLKDRRVDPSKCLGNLIDISIRGAKSTSIVKILLKDGRIKPNLDCLRSASTLGMFKLVDILLKSECLDVSQDRESMVLAAYGQKKVLKRLLREEKLNPNLPNSDGEYPIIEAALSKCNACLLMLLDDKRVDPSVKDNELIKIIASSGNMFILRRLVLDNRVDPNVIGEIK
eukprot:TRINITY_DN4904_c0_g2_i1.p1 TRINITY_DN4904_c0_g2~~TRINITY_DN4904_c0_g2_i1.p1  ORF type:complete len:421 (-),score=71.65 TRINITY_DN4904_c0_g2_i1:33-1295(-)